MKWGRSWAVAALVATSFAGVSWTAHAAGGPCGPDDRPETGVQGDVPVADQLSGRSRQGYWCNVRPVAHDDFDGQGGDIQLTWLGNCAFQAVPKGNFASDGIAAVDMTNPAHPVTKQIVRLDQWAGKGGTLGIHEGIHTSAATHRLVVPIANIVSVLTINRDCTLDVAHEYDVVDNAPDSDPTHDPTYGAGGIHSGQLTPDGRFFLATNIGNGAVAPNGPCLTVYDLAKRTVPMRWAPDFPCHDLDIRPDGTRAYVGWYAAKVGHPSAVVGAFTPVGASHVEGGAMIVDITGLAAGREPRIISQLDGGRQHTEVYTKIGNREYLLGAEEAYCPNGNGRIIDITDELHPIEVAEIPLAINTVPNCGQASYNQNADVLHYMSHYLSVDDRTNAHLAFFTWYGSGLRVFDISNPKNPHEVAYFNPPVGAGAKRTQDSSTSYPRYVPRTGQIWFGSEVNGLNVVELAPALRPTGGRWSVGPTTATITASGAARTIAAGAAPVGYCTLGG